MASKIRKRALPAWMTGVAVRNKNITAIDADMHEVKAKEAKIQGNNEEVEIHAKAKEDSDEKKALNAEQIVEMSYKEFIFSGSIIYSHNKDDCNIICEEIISKIDASKDTPVGFDTEWPVTYKKGGQEKTALIQVCLSVDTCYLFHISCMTSFPIMLKKLLEMPSVKKIGLNIENDMWKLDVDHDLKAKDIIKQSIIELRTLANKRLKTSENWSLEGLTRNVLKMRISKDEGIRKCDWRQFPLPEQQQRYAATDTVVSLMLYNKLITR